MTSRILSTTFRRIFSSPLHTQVIFKARSYSTKVLHTCSSVEAHRSVVQLPLVLSSLKRACSSQVFITRPKVLEEEEVELDKPCRSGIAAVEDVNIDFGSKQLIVSWQDGDSQIFPFVWLRDNCRCPICFHPAAFARLTQAHQLDINIIANSAHVSPDGRNVVVQWEDGHESEYPGTWLREYRFNNSPHDHLLNPKYFFWDADIDLQHFDFHEVLEDDRALYDWLYNLVTQGIAVVKNTPREVGQLHRLGERVAFLRPCNYGPTFQVKSKLDPSNAAYTSGALGLHTDLAYYIREPGIQMLHCIEQAECTGGENLFSDGFKVAMDLKQLDPQAFHLLTTYQFEFFDVGKDHFGDFYQHSRHPTITLNEQGEIASVSVSDHSRDPMLRAPVDQVLPIYQALKKYCNLLLDPENVLKYKMKGGDIVTFNNRRTLHGRGSFQITKASGRHLEGGYLEWDEVNSRLRVLAMQLKNQIQ